jgi:hypothetical protein
MEDLMEEENDITKVLKIVGEMMAVIELIEEKGTRADFMKSLFELNRELKKLTKVV